MPETNVDAEADADIVTVAVAMTPLVLRIDVHIFIPLGGMPPIPDPAPVLPPPLLTALGVAVEFTPIVTAPLQLVAEFCVIDNSVTDPFDEA